MSPERAPGSDVSGERRYEGAEERRPAMKFMISTYATQADYDAMGGKPAPDAEWSPADFAAMGDFMGAFNRELDESGELVETRGLDAPVHTRRIQLKQGLPVVTDGPYAETQEVLAGYWIVECASFDRATEIAAKLSTIPGPESVRERAYADVRPIVESQAELAEG
jgi:hypothetical protein